MESLRRALSYFAHYSNDIFAKNSRKLVCDEQASFSAPLIVWVETCCRISVRRWTLNVELMWAWVSVLVRLTSNSNFDQELTTSRLWYRAIMEKHKWLSNLLNEEGSLCRHLLYCSNKVQLRLGMSVGGGL
jgi:hypothetical protein